MLVHGRDLQDFLELTVEEAGMAMLPELVNAGGAAGFGAVLLNNILRTFDARAHQMGDVSDAQLHLYYRHCAEAWQWLRNQGFLAPHPESDGWEGATRLAQSELQRGDYLARIRGLSVLRHAVLDTCLEAAVRDDFRQGRYGDAVLAAMREVEIRVRELAGLDQSLIGLDLMRRAFGPGCSLEDVSLVKAERERRADLFAAAVGYYGSPTHHRNVTYSDTQDAAEVVLFANNLLRVAEDAARAARRLDRSMEE